jgi:hypothetical protein
MTAHMTDHEKTPVAGGPRGVPNILSSRSDHTAATSPVDTVAREVMP